MSNVDDVQDAVDKLVLSVFDGMRSRADISLLSTSEEDWTNIQEKHKEQVDKIANSFITATNHVNSLIGINRSKEDQVEELSILSNEYHATRLRILDHEKTLRDLSKQVDEVLLQVI
jgi:hypothetical protein